MVVFKNLSYRNFLSTGDIPTSINLDSHTSTLVVGTNGSGKCLRGNTEVDIIFSNKKTEDKFTSFLEAKQSCLL